MPILPTTGKKLELSFEAGEKLGLGPVETGDKVRSIIGHLAMQVLEQVPVSGVFLTVVIRRLAC